MLEDLGISGDFFLRIVLLSGDYWKKTIEEAYPDKQVFIPEDRTAIVRTPEFGIDDANVMKALEKERDYHVEPKSDNPLRVPYADSYSPNASLAEGSDGMGAKDDSGQDRYGGKCTMTDEPGESIFTKMLYLRLKDIGVDTTSTDALKKLTLTDERICYFVKQYLNDFLKAGDKYLGGWTEKQYVVYRYYLWEKYNSICTKHNITRS